MEDIKDRLGEYRYNYFKNLQNYLDTELYFYGSIKRYDYFEKGSDIDITIITDNVHSKLSKLKIYLNAKKKDVKKIYQNFYENPDRVVVGYKIKYQDDENNLIFDILIYDEKYRDVVMENMDAINNFPSYILVLLVMLKSIYYNLGLITKDMYLQLKSLIFTSYFSKQLILYDKNLSTTIIIDE
jgi:predicted nucleotidyltransferase